MGEKMNDKFKLCITILKSVILDSKKTNLVISSSQNMDLINGYLSILLDKGLLRQDEEGRYLMTEKGLTFYNDYKRLLDV